ncbi:flagellin [Mobilicoccus sp.]|uniref:flagellin N-terminal helical domain-containing protein n=1 Tax=Mobilicoccus sp. TaxID=2034349 RepID=UPI00289AD0BE|nr:flagellin [Mobilicoccus sp.]
MGLQINTNVNALNAYRNLTGTQSSMTTSLERLSSGLRINRAADDAAGLAISEKLRAQVNGLNQAQANAQDGVSLIQTAEGALNETHSILQRMRTLTVQAASDTNTDSDRQQIQKEINELNKELTGISTRTQFNGMGLLDGTFTNKTLQIGANGGHTMGINIGATSAESLALSRGGAKVQPQTTNFGAAAVTAPLAVDETKGKLAEGTYTLKANAASGGVDVFDKDNVKVGVAAGAKVTFDSGAVVTAGANVVAGESFKVANTNFTATVAGTGGAVTAQKGNINAGEYTVAGANGNILDANKNVVGVVNGATATFDEAHGGGSVTFTDALDATSKLTVATYGSGVDLGTQATAVDALKTIDVAIGKVSGQRAQLGALQNRLDHTIKNLGVSAENLAASESRIRDTDMAKEMTNFTRSQILQQAGVSMLAQANQSSQSVLKLLG